MLAQLSLAHAPRLVPGRRRRGLPAAATSSPGRSARRAPGHGARDGRAGVRAGPAAGAVADGRRSRSPGSTCCASCATAPTSSSSSCCRSSSSWPSVPPSAAPAAAGWASCARARVRWATPWSSPRRSGDLAVDLRERGTIDELRAGVEDGELDLGLAHPAGLRRGACARAGTSRCTLVARPDSLRRRCARSSRRPSPGSRPACVRRAWPPTTPASASTRRWTQAGAQQASAAGITRPDHDAWARPPSRRVGNPFALGAQSQTVLFMFLTSMTAATPAAPDAPAGGLAAHAGDADTGPLHPPR